MAGNDLDSGVAQQHRNRHRNARHNGPAAWRWILGSNVVLLPAGLTLIYTPASPMSERADDFFGWREIASRVDATAGARPDLALAADRYQIASELAFYTGRPVTCFNIRSRPNQYDLWQDPQALAGRDYLLVDTGPIETTKTADRFRSLKLLDRIQVQRGARLAHDLFIFEATSCRPEAGGPPR